MYVIYNCVLARWSNPPSLWETLRDGNNLFSTTLSVLVSAVQKLSTVTVIPDGLRVYRGTGGLTYLPEHFTQPDDYNCRGMTEWGFLSCSSNKNIAVQFSGLQEQRPHCMVIEIQPSCADRGASVAEFSQYPTEEEILFLPLSYLQQTGRERVEKVAGGHISVIPVRVNVNLKAERLEHIEQSKKSIHISEFALRIQELREKLHEICLKENAEGRLKNEQTPGASKAFQTTLPTVNNCVDALICKVQAVLEKHRSHGVADYSDDAIYRSLISESQDTAHMAQSALLWWLRDPGQTFKVLQDFPLIQSHRFYESFLRLQHSLAACDDTRRLTALTLCKARNLLRHDVNECDYNQQSPLLSLAVHGASQDDIELLVTAGADLACVDTDGRSAVYV
jgi:hypothetical protein